MSLKIDFVGSPNYWAGRTQKLTTIVIHWMAGTLAGTDAVFHSNVGTDAATSAHYGIENKTIHQYVKDTDTAWHARQANPYSIGIEHSAQPGRKASAETLETSAQLLAILSKKHGIALNRTYVIPHSQVVATSCPGTIPIDAIIKRANKLSGKGGLAVLEPIQKTAPANKLTTGSLHLPANAKSWRVYKPTGPYSTKYAIAQLAPSLFGGLTYDILGNPAPNVYLIQTSDFGKVAIYAGAETGAQVAASKQGIHKGSGGGKTVHLPATPTWKVYKKTGPYTIGHQIGNLAPARYGGLSYAVLSQPVANVAVIHTQTFGTVAIYVGKETGATIT